MKKKLRAPKFETLISSPWASRSPVNSYYGDPSYVNKEQYGLEHLERDKADDEGVEQVVILGYN
ncbi:MAG: hypothetical protein GY875_01560 [Gammaproteobacteria bacterium]|nr:hypothetical protein [Gammaproteobacteria bacterium]